MQRTCPQCGTANRDTARFCINCAAPVVSEIICPACRTPNPPAARFCLHCAAPLRGATPPTGMLPPNTVLSGRYIILRKVGGGGMGAVYQATDQRIPGKLWAVKEMSDLSIADPADKQRAVEAFRQEAQLLATLDHGNLPKVSDFFTENGKHYLVGHSGRLRPPCPEEEDRSQNDGTTNETRCRMPDFITLTTTLNRQALLAAGQTQLVYLLVELMPAPELATVRMPLNIGLVLDQSGSMGDGGKLDHP